MWSRVRIPAGLKTVGARAGRSPSLVIQIFFLFIVIWLTGFFCNQFIVLKYEDAFYILPPYKTMCVIKVYIQHREVRHFYRGDHVAIQKLLLGTVIFSAPTIGGHRAYPLNFC